MRRLRTERPARQPVLPRLQGRRRAEVPRQRLVPFSGKPGRKRRWVGDPSLPACTGLLAKRTVEQVKFGTQLLQNPDISGVEYQQGTLFEYELWEYLLGRFGHQRAYCGGTSGEAVLNIDHVIPRLRGGSDRVGNPAVVCRTCNEAKGNQIPEHGWKN